MNLKLIFIIGIFGIHLLASGQKNVSITIDDVPNTARFQKDGFQSKLLDELDSMKIPIAIFINEGLIYKTDSITQNFNLLREWIEKDYVILGNHSFNHSRYSSSGFDSFSKEIKLGESITKELSKKYDKSLRYFRFPYNDLGLDSIQHIQIKSFLENNDYVVTPFTIESSDWMYNAVYKHYLDNNMSNEANKIGEEYVMKTLAYFDYYEALSLEDYNRPINQIYLCHDNILNADFMPKLISQLAAKDYNFISLDEAMSDQAYEQGDNYYKKWGISWMYRWKEDQKDLYKQMQNEPTTNSIIELYDKLPK